MKHYSVEEWQEFCNDPAGLENRTQMEDHLLECEDCRRMFLQSVEAVEIEKSALIIPPDFTERTLRRAVGKTETMAVKKVYPSRQRLLAFYASAAAITLILMGGGVFQNLAVKTTQINRLEPAGISLRVTAFLNHWPDEVKTGLWSQIDKLECIYSKEVER